MACGLAQWLRWRPSARRQPNGPSATVNQSPAQSLLRLGLATFPVISYHWMDCAHPSSMFVVWNSEFFTGLLDDGRDLWIVNMGNAWKQVMFNLVVDASKQRANPRHVHGEASTLSHLHLSPIHFTSFLVLEGTLPCVMVWCYAHPVPHVHGAEVADCFESKVSQPHQTKWLISMTSTSTTHTSSMADIWVTGTPKYLPFTKAFRYKSICPRNWPGNSTNKIDDQGCNWSIVGLNWYGSSRRNFARNVRC